MAQKEENTLQSMYEHQRLAAPNGEEYIVRGAEVFCGWGEHSCVMNLPEDHGEVTTDNCPLITVKDSTIRNVKGFGYCKLIGDTCIPSLSGWSNSSGNVKKIRDVNTGDYEYAVTRSATANCAKQKGDRYGFAAFSSSGQVVPDYSDEKIEGAVDIVENIKGSWSRNGSKGMDFLGHIKAKHAGVYNLGIYVTNNNDSYKGGSIFFYKKQGFIKKTLKYIGVYELCEHKNEKLEGFKDSEEIIHISTGNSPMRTEKRTFYWTIWATMALDKGTDYYVEIDCPDIKSYDYKFICLEYIDKETIIEKMNQLMCNINTFMKNTNSAVPRVYKAIDDAIKLHSVVAIGISGSAGLGGYISVAAQLVIDLHGNIGLQFIPGTGAEAGASADATAYVAVYPGMDDISGVEGFGTEVGGSIGEAFIGSAALLLSGEGDDMALAGFMGGIGIGGEGFVLEGHTAISNTFPTVRLGNVHTYSWDQIYGLWKTIYSAWGGVIFSMG